MKCLQFQMEIMVRFYFCLHTPVFPLDWLLPLGRCHHRLLDTMKNHSHCTMDNALLAQIQKGRKLKKAETNDRSAPAVSASKPSGGGHPINTMGRPPVPGMTPPPIKAQPPSLPHTASAPPVASTGPQLGGLFTNGMPTLRKTRGAAVNTGRGSSAASPAPPAPAIPTKYGSSVPPPPPPPPPPSSTPNAPKSLAPTQTLPRNFKMPPVPGRSLPTPTPPVIASGVPPKTQAALVPPPPPPPPMASGVSPKIQAALIPPVPGRTRSNSSPQRPVPPPPPRMAPSPPASPVVPRSQLAVPPLPPGRPRASSAANSTTKPSSPFAGSINVPLTEGGRYTFRSLADLPLPRACSKSVHIFSF
ncbi:hypothetical protein BY458DRAFT_526049 [Sporodiniella umbellata]|nr:hypothetical protein BY458DRAFT_526049 [Sporodiniella umbellata]